MSESRETIRKLGLELAQITFNGGGSPSSRALAVARKLEQACVEGGAYKKRYEDHEERVLMRHLNLYKNKIAKAKSSVDRDRWKAKLADQEVKIAVFHARKKGGTTDLDLDGL